MRGSWSGAGMQFGYGLITCQRYPGDDRSDAELYGEALDLALEAEELGFDSVWTSEHHFWDDAYAPSLLPLSAAMAARTTTVRIGTGLVLAPMHHPLRLAEDVAVVDVISGGRFTLGLGLAWLPWELEAFGTSMGERVARTEAAIRICRQAWGDGLVEGFGVAVTPKPAQPGGPPIWLGAIREPAVRRAGRIADGWMAGEPALDELQRQVEWLRDEAASAGRPEDDVAVAGFWPVFVGGDASRAWEDVRPYAHYVDWKYDDQEGGKGRTGPPAAPPQLDDEAERALRSAVIVGDPDQVAERIRELADAAGPRFTFIARMYYPGMDRALMRRSTRMFAQHVIPALRSIGEPGP